MSRTPQQTFDCVDFSTARLFQSSDLDETRFMCGKVFSPHELRVITKASRFNSQMDHLRLGRVSLNRLTWGAPVSVDPDRLASYYLISMPVRGEAQFKLGGSSTQVSAHCAGIVNASQRFSFEASEGFEQIAVRLERSAVEDGWQALTGRPAPGPIDFNCAVRTVDAGWRALEPVMHLLARASHDAHQGRHSAFLHARLEELVVATLLLNQQHTYSQQLLRPAQPSRPVHARRAERFMLERLTELLTVSDVAGACGVSIRSLQAAFHSAHGCGPMAWLRARRLDAVRDALSVSEAAPGTITATAMQFGFTHLGEFAKAYRQQFGETPSATLSRRR